jgi:predicted deacetylase
VSAVPRSERTIAVALHEVEPATFERCALIRDWLDDHGVGRVTLLVIPARDLHPLGERSPELVRWLLERRRMGDAVAQHGFQHEQLRRPGWQRRVLVRPRTARAGRSAEFVGLDDPETRRAVDAGWRLLKLAGIEPDGFVAPAYAYTGALRQALGMRFRWWADLLRVHRVERLGCGAPTFGALAGGGERRLALASGGGPSGSALAPAWSFAVGGPVGRAVSPTLVRAGSLLPTCTLRLDLHPTDLRQPRHMRALESVLRRCAGRRTAITYGELAGA